MSFSKGDEVMNAKEYLIRSAIYGHAVGDALGVPVEFSSRQELVDAPVEKMEGFGTYPFPAGTWSDDTSMTLATLDSLSSGIDFEDMMKKFCDWFENARYTPSGVVFDIGNATRKSIFLYLTEKRPAVQCGQKSEWDNGNGSLMRMMPLALCCELSLIRSLPTSSKINYIEKCSSLTHAHRRSMIGCGIFFFVVSELIKEKSKTAILEGLRKAREFYGECDEFSHYSKLYSEIAELDESEISGSGYVVNTLCAAIWCLLTTDNYRDCVLKAVNLGEDTDTTAAVAGGLAGILYGYNAIPYEWIATLIAKGEIDRLCESAAKAWQI